MILGEKEFLKDLEKLSSLDLYNAAAKSIKMVQGEAKERAVGKKSSGELRDSIYTKIETGPDYVQATCYTNKSYAMYYEFGTGPVGQENHEGTSPDVNYAYNQKGWIMPASAMSKKDAEEYGFGIIRGKNGEIIGYATNGQPAHPFMYPALKNQEPEIEKIFEQEVKKLI